MSESKPKRPHLADLAVDERGVYGLRYGKDLKSEISLRVDKLEPMILSADLSLACSTEKSPLEVHDDFLGGPQRFRPRHHKIGYEIRPAFLHNIPKARDGADVLENSIRNTILNATRDVVSDRSLSMELEARERQARWKGKKNSEVPEEVLKERRHYFAVRSMMRKVFAHLWKETLKCCHPEALKLARRFPPSLRMLVYNLAATSQRRLQAFQVCPVLATYCFEQRGMPYDMAVAIEKGVKLREILEQEEIPWLARKLLPITTFILQGEMLAIDVGDQDGPGHSFFRMLKWLEPEFHAFLPRTAMGQFRWVHAMQVAKERGRGSSFPQWVIRHAPLHLKTLDLRREVGDMADWYRETYRPVHGQPPVVPDFGWNHAMELSAEWHRNTELRRYPDANDPFPEPWLPGDEIKGYQLVPLKSGHELVDEGKRMHHCVASYASMVIRGDSYIYSVREKGQPLGTLELGLTVETPSQEMGMPRNAHEEALNKLSLTSEYIYRARIKQLRGVCNKEVPKAVFRAVEAWIDKHSGEVVVPKKGASLGPW